MVRAAAATVAKAVVKAVAWIPSAERLVAVDLLHPSLRAAENSVVYCLGLLRNGGDFLPF